MRTAHPIGIMRAGHTCLSLSTVVSGEQTPSLAEPEEHTCFCSLLAKAAMLGALRDEFSARSDNCTLTRF
eukprot:4927998-Amphidinium_carterae.1